MKKFYILTLISFLLLLPKLLLKTNYIDDFLDDFDIKYERNLKKYLKKYLISNNLFNNERIVEIGEMRKIFLDVMLEGASIDEIDNNTKEIYEELAKIFLQKYYKENEEIRGKDIYDLININEITQKFYELNGEVPLYDDDIEITMDDDDDDDDNKKKDSDDYDYDYMDL